MIKKLLALSISIAFSAAPGVSQAEGSISMGKSNASQCTGCHGEDGNSMISSFPKLAGQHESYLVKQLQAFKDGSRNDSMMASLAQDMDLATIENFSAYYASQKVSKNDLPLLDDDDDEDSSEGTNDQSAELDSLLTLGSDLYLNGNLKTNVSACIACHGPSGDGNKPASFPVLRSQHADYLIKSLTDFKKGSRNNNSDSMMHLIAKKMTDKEIKAVSYHLSMMK